MNDSRDREVLKRIEEPIVTAQEIMVVLSRTSTYAAGIALKLATNMLEFRLRTDLERESKHLDQERNRDLEALKDSLENLREVFGVDKPQ